MLQSMINAQRGSERSFSLITLLHLHCHLRFVCQCLVFCFVIIYSVSRFVFAVPSCVSFSTGFHLSLNHTCSILRLWASATRYFFFFILFTTRKVAFFFLFFFCHFVFSSRTLSFFWDFWFCLLSSLHPVACGGMFSLFFFVLLPASAPGKSFVRII